MNLVGRAHGPSVPAGYGPPRRARGLGRMPGLQSMGWGVGRQAHPLRQVSHCLFPAGEPPSLPA